MTHVLTSLQRRLEAAFPSARTSLDLPASDHAPAWLDFWLDTHHAIVEAAPAGPFRLTLRNDVLFGEGPDESYATEDEVFLRITQLLLRRVSTHRPLSLADLRKRRRISQARLAEDLRLQQATISRFERRDDVMLSTIAAYVKALGGRLEVHAVFGEESHQLTVGSEPQVRTG